MREQHSPPKGPPVTFLLSSFRSGGGERVMLEVASALAGQGESIDIVVLKRVGEYESQVHQDIRIIELDAWRMIFSLPKLVAYMRQEQPIALMATDEYTHLLAIAARFLSGRDTKIVLRIGNVFSELYKRYSGIKRHLTKLLMQRLYRYADAYIGNSVGVADDIAVFARIERSRVRVIYNPKPITAIREKMLESTGCQWLDAKKEPALVAVGRLREQKNFPLLIGVFARIIEKHPAKLIIVSDGRERSRLQALIQEKKVENSVLLAGYQENPFSFIGKADIFVSTSLWEGMPNTLMEAMVCGVPVLASDCHAGPRELISPSTNPNERITSGIEYAPYGVLTAVNDAEALYGALNTLLADEQIRKRYAEAAIQRSHAFDLPATVGAYADVLGLTFPK